MKNIITIVRKQKYSSNDSSVNRRRNIGIGGRIDPTHYLFMLIALILAGCSQSIVVSKQGDQFSNNNISFDQFNRLREGKYFEMVLLDSSVIPLTLLRAGSDSIRFETGEGNERRSLPTGSVSMLIYHQNDNGFNAMIGAFAGLVIGGAVSRSLFDFNDNASSIEGFAMVVGGTVIGGMIGYHSLALSMLN